MKVPRPKNRWGLYNMGNLWSVHTTRRDCIRHAEKMLGEPWRQCRDYMEVHKVTVTGRAAAKGDGQ